MTFQIVGAVWRNAVDASTGIRTGRGRWTAATDPASAGKSFQLDPGHLTATDNDVRANWCYGSTVYVMVGIVSDVGTPGAPNVQCP